MRATCLLPAFLLLATLNGIAAENKLPWPAPDAAAREKLAAELRQDLPEKDFIFIDVGPWLVTTDMEKPDAQRMIDGAIKLYVASLQRQLFTKKPRQEPVKVYLFKDGESYNSWNKKLFGEKPTTPYGYFSRAKKALVMNIGTGGGTLIHEMVHAMAEADFPNIPAWLNEGIGSLYEASGHEANGHIIGLTNWRLPGLLDALKGKTAPKLEDLLKISDNDFYGDQRGVNYAASRYLMQWLQEQKKLEAFYVRIRDKNETAGAAALKAVFDDKLSLDEIEARYHEWVLKLKPVR